MILISIGAGFRSSIISSFFGFLNFTPLNIVTKATVEKASQEAKMAAKASPNQNKKESNRAIFGTDERGFSQRLVVDQKL